MGRYNYTKALERLTLWANKEGYEVNFDYEDVSTVIYYQTADEYLPNEIKIEGRHPIEIKVYLLLHELGHHILRKDWEKFQAELPITAHAEQVYLSNNDVRYMRRVVYSVSCLEEEFKAWEEGYKLAKRLNIRVNGDKWHELRGRSLMSYMRYYANKSF